MSQPKIETSLYNSEDKLIRRTKTLSEGMPKTYYQYQTGPAISQIKEKPLVLDNQKI